ncbi:hypothetical protein BDY21DRAFT_371176 [Lineolata rhizophorae]|uniref:Uncharacterized protein n=1 Tax=Lineolata rhizophorae TaxID=578093 RepID=A0A6A6P3K7_9PEZI|nr:hypothetical protein BDY21DRAFT_371176 [Lineolata rhizophorae]
MRGSAPATVVLAAGGTPLPPSVDEVRQLLLNVGEWVVLTSDEVRERPVRPSTPVDWILNKTNGGFRPLVEEPRFANPYPGMGPSAAVGGRRHNYNFIFVSGQR